MSALGTAVVGAQACRLGPRGGGTAGGPEHVAYPRNLAEHLPPE